MFGEISVRDQRTARPTGRPQCRRREDSQVARMGHAGA